MFSYPFKIITTSWDDGHELDLKLALLLKKYNIKATFYPASRNREWSPKDLLTDAQIKKLNQDFEIGAHTLTHPHLTQISLNTANQEIIGSKQYLEKLLHQPVNMFCYPSGDYNQSIINLVQKAGFIGARTIKPLQSAPPKNYYEFATTMHTVYRKINYSFRLALINNPRFIPFIFTKDWVTISCKTFDIVRKHGGIWHFWGHSWQLEVENFWQPLETVLKYISHQHDVHYLSNGQTIEYLKNHDKNHLP